MRSRRKRSASQSERLATYLDRLSRVAGHADRIVPMQNYTQGLFLPIERKSVEPMAARLAPAKVRQTHQSLQCAVESTGPQRDETRPGTGSFHPVAIGAAVEVTKPSEPSV